MPVIYVPGPPGATPTAIGHTVPIPVYVPEIPGPVGGQGVSGGGTVTAVPVPTAGPPGPPGGQGLQSPPGVAIPVNMFPIPGPMGRDGAQGIQGIKGDKGDQGDKGDKGDQGLQGIQGIQGIRGLSGTAAGRIIFAQNTPAMVWIIDHNTGTYPEVVVIDTSGNIIEGDIYYPSLNEIVITFSAPFGGTAVLT